MKKGVKVTVVSLLVGLLLPFSLSPVFAASSSSVSNIIINERTVITDIEFQVSMESSSSNSSIDVPQYFTYDRYTYKTVCLPDSQDPPSYTCKLYRSTSGSSSTEAQQYEINAAHSEDITLNLTETFGNSVRYSYTVKNIYQIIFNDGELHTGYIDFTSDVSDLKLMSDNENVGSNSNRIYFFDKGVFDVYYMSRYNNESAVILDAPEDITINSLYEADTDEYGNDIYELVKAFKNQEKPIYWDIPVESFPMNWALFYNLGSDYQSIRNSDYWQQYPIFNVASGSTIIRYTAKAGTKFDVLVGLNQNVTASTIGNFFTASAGTLSLTRHITQFSPSYRFIHFTITNDTDEVVSINYVGSSAKLIGIYMKRSDQGMGMSADFQSVWFSNIQNDTASDLDAGGEELIDTVDEFDEASDTIHNMDVDALDDMDDKLSEIDLTSPGIIDQQGFTRSAVWVRNQFTRMITSNPLGQLVTYSLTIGLVLVLLGKLRS